MLEVGSVALPLVHQFLPLQLRILAQERVILCLIMDDVIINNDSRTRLIRHRQTADCQGAVRPEDPLVRKMYHVKQQWAQ